MASRRGTARTSVNPNASPRTPDTSSVVSSFVSSLSDPTNPTTCSKHLVGCLLALTKAGNSPHSARDLRTNHHELYDTCMSFLVNPPTDETMKTLQLRLQTCTCDIANNETIRFVHLPADASFPDMSTLFVDIAMLVTLALQPTKRDGNLYKVESNERKAIEKGLHASPWPAEPRNIFPLGPERTIRALEQWIIRYSYPQLLGLLGSYLEISKSVFLPHFIASPFFPGFFIASTRKVLFPVWQRVKDSDKPRCAESLVMLKSAALIPLVLVNLCTKDQLVHFVQQAEAQEGSVIDFCGFVLDWLPELYLSISPRSSYDVYIEGRGHTIESDVNYISTHFVLFGACIHSRLGLPDDASRYNWRILAFSKLTKEAESDPKSLAFQAFVDLYHDQRCYAPGCDETFIEAGRKFATCSGCGRVPYCSKSCLV